MGGFVRLTTRKGTRIPPNGVQGLMWFFTYLGSCGQGACRSGAVRVYCRWVCWVDTYGCQDEHYQWRGWQILCWPNSWPYSLELRLFDVWGPLLPGSRRKDVCKGGGHMPRFLPVLKIVMQHQFRHIAAITTVFTVKTFQF